MSKVVGQPFDQQGGGPNRSSTGIVVGAGAAGLAAARGLVDAGLREVYWKPAIGSGVASLPIVRLVICQSTAIVSLPIGVLKVRAVQFSPASPGVRQQAIDHLSITSVVKLVY